MKVLLSTFAASLFLGISAGHMQVPVVLDNAGLKTMLDGMGYEPKALSEGYLLAIKQDSWTFNMQVRLSSDATKIGINANLGGVEKPDDVPAASWLGLLEANTDIDPSAFYFDSKSKKLYLHRVLDNHDVTPALLRKQIDSFCGNIKSTADLWKFTK